MIEVSNRNDPQIIASLKGGGIGVLRTDTLYGVVARADDETAVERVYSLKHRDEAKSPIVLISDVSQLYDAFPAQHEALTNDEWPARTTIIIPSENAPSWIKRDNASVAYRLPHDDELRRLIDQTGPLIAPSANPEDLSPAMSVAEAKAYFDDKVDFYVDGGAVTNSTPSTIVRIDEHGYLERLR